MKKSAADRAREEREIQRKYYVKTALQYNRMHVREQDPHFFALSFMLGVLDYLKIESILDIGSGTGRVLAYVKDKHPRISIVGVEPVKELREVGYAQGISREHLIEGDATKLEFADGTFDLVCAFGVLHHIHHPQRAVSEMLRVAGKAIFISDSNNFGQGSVLKRTIKQAINALGLWRFADLIKTGGRGYTITEGDGLAYSYSIFNNHRLIRQHCEGIHMLNTGNGGDNFYRSAPQIALLGIKKQESPVR